MTTTPAHPRLAIVTGGDSGMGKAVAELLAVEGFDVGITYHSDQQGADDTRAGIEQRGQRCFVARQDQASPDTGNVVDELAEQLGGVGVLVNNAGTGHSDRALDLSACWEKPARWQRCGPRAPAWWSVSCDGWVECWR